MKHVIQTKEDIRSLQGKFVLQVNSDEPDKRLMDYSWGFVKEKRLKMVIGNGFVDLYGYQSEFKTQEEFMRMFNDYDFGREDSKGKRFHRLLTSKEIDYLASKMKEENY